MHKISKLRLKEFAAYKEKKYREADGVYVVEGDKIVRELLQSNEQVLHVLALPEWIVLHHSMLRSSIEVFELTVDELQRVSSLKTPNQVLAVVAREVPYVDMHQLQNQLCLALDEVHDPGNMGTIIRLANWFGIQHIFCSPHSVDSYNPKALQATMGAFLRVNVMYTDLNTLADTFRNDLKLPVYGSFLRGDNIYETTLSGAGLIVMGNESKGISASLEAKITNRLTIPDFSSNNVGSESLNVAIATAIICSEFRRRPVNIMGA